METNVDEIDANDAVNYNKWFFVLYKYPTGNKLQLARRENAVSKENEVFCTLFASISEATHVFFKYYHRFLGKN